MFVNLTVLCKREADRYSVVKALAAFAKLVPGEFRRKKDVIIIPNAYYLQH